MKGRVEYWVFLFFIFNFENVKTAAWFYNSHQVPENAFCRYHKIYFAQKGFHFIDRLSLDLLKLFFLKKCIRQNILFCLKKIQYPVHLKTFLVWSLFDVLYSKLVQEIQTCLLSWVKLDSFVLKDKGSEKLFIWFLHQGLFIASLIKYKTENKITKHIRVKKQIYSKKTLDFILEKAHYLRQM